MVAGVVSKFTGNADGLSESVQDVEGAQHKWSRVSRDPCASGLTRTNAGATFAVFVAQNRCVETGNELIPRPNTKKGANEPMRASPNTWMNPNTELEFCTALVSQLCQVLNGYNCVNVGLKLLESEQMDCRGAGVTQATLCARMFVIASMAPMVSMAWVDVMAPELKSERKKVHWFGAHLLHTTLRMKPFVLLLFRPHRKRRTDPEVSDGWNN